MPNFQAGKDFVEAISEVTCLLEIARSGEGLHPAHPAHTAHAALLKSSVLLLMTKVESFLESILEECRYFLEQCDLKTSVLPNEMIVAILQSTFDDSLIAKVRSGNIQALERLKHLSPFLSGSRSVNLPIEIKFSYGRHGENEVRKIFKKMGVADIFHSVGLLESAKASDNDFSSVITADINSLTAIRNNIIHSDASPAFTVEQVEGFVGRFSTFALLVVSLLTSHCNELRAADAVK